MKVEGGRYVHKGTWAGTMLATRAIGFNDGRSVTSEVARYEPDPWGSSDMHGNERSTSVFASSWRTSSLGQGIL